MSNDTRPVFGLLLHDDCLMAIALSDNVLDQWSLNPILHVPCKQHAFCAGEPDTPGTSFAWFGSSDERDVSAEQQGFFAHMSLYCWRQS